MCENIITLAAENGFFRPFSDVSIANFGIFRELSLFFITYLSKTLRI